MSETDDRGVSSAVDDVLTALAPLTEGMDTLAGFVVKHGCQRAAGHPPDPEVVEVHIILAPPRHPKEVDMAMGMLQGNGYSPRSELRGGQSTVRRVLSVRVTGEDEDATPRGDGEQATF
jgi:hypothetical protein